MGEKGVTKRAFDKDWMLFPEDKEARLPSPVTTYKLSPEELAELDKLPKPTGKAPIRLQPGKKRKEDETMPAIELTEAEAKKILPPEILNNLPLVDDGQDSPAVPGEDQEEKPKTRFETLQEKLTKDQYLALKLKGLTDKEVFKEIGVPYWADTLTRFKKMWGLNALQPEKPQTEPTEPAPPAAAANEIQERIDNIRQHLTEREEEPRAQTATSGLTIAQAVELREELKDDLISIEHLMSVLETGYKVTDRVEKLITWYRDEYQRSFDRLNEAFERTVLPL